MYIKNQLEVVIILSLKLKSSASMMYSVKTLFICFVFGLIICQVSLADEVCDQTKCKGPLTYYKSVGCKPKFESGNDCCAYSYDCSHLKNRSPKKCYVRDHEYELYEKIDDKFTGGRCDYYCVCAENRDELATATCVVSDFVSPPLMRPDCYHRRNAVCGPTEAICPETPGERPTCQVDGNTYLDGKEFTPASEPYKTCYCHPEYKGENIEPFCSGQKPPENYCYTELHYGPEIYRKCAPVETNENYSDCTVDFKCPSPDDVVIQAGPSDTPNNETCEYGDLILNKGDKLENSTNIFGCLSCVCEVGPALTCRYVSRDQCS